MSRDLSFQLRLSVDWRRKAARDWMVLIAFNAAMGALYAGISVALFASHHPFAGFLPILGCAAMAYLGTAAHKSRRKLLHEADTIERTGDWP